MYDPKYDYLFDHDALNDFLMKLLTANKEDRHRAEKDADVQKKDLEQSAEYFLEDGRLVVFDDEDTLVYTLYLKEQFIPVAQKDIGKDIDLTLNDIVAIYEYPISEINTLFWEQKPNEDLLDHPVWKKEQKDIDEEIESLKKRLEKLQARKAL